MSKDQVSQNEGAAGFDESPMPLSRFERAVDDAVKSGPMHKPRQPAKLSGDVKGGDAGGLAAARS